RRPVCARRGSGANAGPDRTRAPRPPGRSSRRAAQRARARVAGVGSPPLYPGTVDVATDLERIAAAAQTLANGDVVVAVLAAQPADGIRRYLCAFEGPGATRSWLALDDAAEPLTNRSAVHDAATILALCELAEECAFPGDLDELRSQLV